MTPAPPRSAAASIVSGLITALVLTVLPLLGNPSRLASPIFVETFLAVFIIAATHPPLKLGELFTTAAEAKSGLIIMLGAISSTIAPLIEYGYRDAMLPRLDSPLFIIGSILLAAGVSLRVWAVRVLGRFFTSVVQVQEHQTVIQDGPYRLIRHPSYTGALISGFGGAMVCQSVVGALATAGLLLPAYLYRIHHEERWLSSQLGAEYRAYRGRSKALVPFIW